MRLLTYGNAKIEKGLALNYLTAIMHLAPAKLSGFQVCPMASKGCAAGCLNTSGRGVYQRTQQARIRKTRQFFLDRETFMRDLVSDIYSVIRRARKLGMIPAIRLNGTSDITWETVPVNGKANIFEVFPDVQFYDYSKRPNRHNLPANYHLTFSRSESNDDMALSELFAGFNVAVVFRKTLPATWHGFPVINGVEHDLRFLDPQNVVVGLVAKGKARRDNSGFVID